MSPILCVVDTNVLLHALPLDKIPWRELLEVAEVEIVLVSRVLRELDDKKNGDSEKLKKRAKRVLSLINEWLPQGTRTAQIAEGVSVRVHSKEPAARDGLDFSVSDDRILACVLELRDGNDVRLVSGDTSMRFKAEDWGVKVVVVPDAYRVREEEPAKVNRAAAPELIVGFFDQDAQPKSHIEVHPAGLSAVNELAFAERQLRTMQRQAEQERQAERAMLEKRIAEGAPFADMLLKQHRDMERYGGLGSMFGDPSAQQPSAEAWERHIEALKRFMEEHAHTASVSIGVTNTGTAPASDIIIEMFFPSDVAVADYEPQTPRAPQAPQAYLRDALMSATMSNAAVHAVAANTLSVHRHQDSTCVRITSKRLMHTKHLTWPIWMRVRGGFQIRGRVLAASPPLDEAFALNVRLAVA